MLIKTNSMETETIDAMKHILEMALKHPHHGDIKKMKVYDILHKKYTDFFENKEIKQSTHFDYLGYIKSKVKWHEYLKSLGIKKFDSKEGIFDPSCHLEWQQRYMQISEEIIEKILTLGLP